MAILSYFLGTMKYPMFSVYLEGPLKTINRKFRIGLIITRKHLLSVNKNWYWYVFFWLLLIIFHFTSDHKKHYILDLAWPFNLMIICVCCSNDLMLRMRRSWWSRSWRSRRGRRRTSRHNRRRSTKSTRSKSKRYTTIHVLVCFTGLHRTGIFFIPNFSYRQKS